LRKEPAWCKTSWLHSLRKEELSEICGSLHLDTKGTLEDMRKAVTALIATPDLSTEQKAKLTELEAQYTPRMLQLPEGTMRGASPKRQAQERISCGAAMARICKWSVRYDGESCALEFIARVEELCEVYDLPTDIMPRIIMELLHGKAAIWYWNNRRVWAGWQEFRQEFLKFFFPIRYLERLDDQVRQTFQLAGEKFRDYALRLQDLMRHLDYTTQQKLDRIARNSQREYQLFFEKISSKDLNEITLAPLPRMISGTSRAPRENAPTTMNTSSATRNVCHRCGQPGHLARDCVNHRVLFCWDCGRPGVLTKDCCRQTAGQHIQARGMTVYESIERRKPPPDAVPKTVETIGSTLVASLTIGGLATTGVVDTGATRSIIREDFIGFIPHIINSETRSHTIRMVDGASQDSKRSITVEAKIGDMSFNLELLVVRRNVDHLTLGMDFLAKTGAVLTVAGHSVKLGSKNSMPTSPSELLFGTQHQDYAFGLDTSGLKVEPLSTGAEHYEEIVPPPPPIGQANRSVHESEVENQSNPEENDRNRKMHKKPAITQQKKKSAKQQRKKIQQQKKRGSNKKNHQNKISRKRIKKNQPKRNQQKRKINTTHPRKQERFPAAGTRKVAERSASGSIRSVAATRGHNPKATQLGITPTTGKPQQTVQQAMSDHACVRSEPLAPVHCCPPRGDFEEGGDLRAGPVAKVPQRGDRNAEEALPLIEVPVPRQYNQVDCGVLALQNLERYLRQGRASWDPLTLPETWSTGAEAQQTRIKIAAVLLELAAMEGEARVSAKEPVDDADDVIIITPTAEPTTVRTMTIEEPASMTTAKETMKPWTNEEPISLGAIVPNNHDDDLLRITPTIGLWGGSPANPKPILGKGDEWAQLERGDPYYCYLRDKYERGQKKAGTLISWGASGAAQSEVGGVRSEFLFSPEGRSPPGQLLFRFISLNASFRYSLSGRPLILPIMSIFP
uniref:CCHC-type domain-containing protein n=1 Tax=Glossina palpalis gambiensis TaxID=67801 RepID=A0A1B0BW69_9MUSC